MLGGEDLRLITDLIYEAAIIPDQWPVVLGRLSDYIDGAGGILFTANNRGTRWTASSNIYDLFAEFLRDGWHAINPRPARLGVVNHAGFIRDNDFFTPEELDTDPVYNGFYRKRGLGWAAGTMLSVPSGDALIFSFEKAHAKGPVSMEAIQGLDQLRPHLARAALLSARFGLEKANAMTQSLAALGLAAAVLHSNGSLFATNRQFDALIPAVMVDSPSRLLISDRNADRLLAEALENLRNGPAAVASIPLAANDERVPLIVHLLPIRRSALDVFSGAAALVIVTPVDRGAVPTADVLAGLFDLTPAEARVAREIANGRTIEEVANHYGLSRETVRTQLKGVLAKTGVKRQADIVAMLTGLALPHQTGSGG